MTTSLTEISDANARLVAARRLTSRSHRRDAGLFLAEGAQAVREALRADTPALELYLTEAAADRHGDLVERALERAVVVSLVSEKAAAGLSETVAPQGLVAVVRRLDVPLEHLLGERPKLLAVVVEPNDPGNLGTIIRTADAAGADGVVIVGQGVDIYNGKLVRATAGSLFHLPLVTGLSWREFETALLATDLQSVATSGSAVDDLDDLIDAGGLTGPTAWLFGNEAHGLGSDVLAAADRAVRIPIHGQAESLNLSIAAALCLYASARAHRRSSSPLRVDGTAAVSGPEA